MSAKILLVEDEALIAMSEAKILRKHGYEVVSVYNGEKAVEAVDSDYEISLVLMDIDLGKGIDGTEAAKRILDRHDIPVVFLTSHSEKEYVDRVRQITNYGYVLKNSGEFVLIESIYMAYALFEAKREYKTQKERYEELFANISSGAAVYQATENGDDFIFIDFNKTAEKIENISKEKVIGKKVTEIFPGVKDFGLFKVMQRVWKTGKAEDHPISQYKDERIVGWRDNYVYRLPTGEIVAVYDDVTEQKIAEINLKKNEENLRTTLNSIGDAVISTDIDGNIVRMNPVAELLTGWSFNAAKGKSLDEIFYIINAFNRQPIDNPAEKVIQTGEIVGLANHTVLISKNGNEYQIADSASPIKDDKGNINGVVLVFRDVTDKYEKEQQLKEREEKYKSLFNNSPVTITIHDINTGQIIDANEMAYKSYGYASLSELKKSGFCMDPPYSINEAFEWIRKAYNEGFQQFEWKNRKVTGEIFWEFVTVRPVSINGIERVLATAIDITKQKETEKELQYAVKEKNTLMQELNHRVKNNLSMVSSLINLKNSALGDEVDLSDIKYQIDAIQTVHEKLSQTEDPTYIELGDYIQAILESLFLNYSSSHVEIVNKIEAEKLPTKKAAPLALITNEIATNAVKYGFVEGENAVFTVSFNKDISENQYVYVLSNTGNPFPEKVDFENPETLGMRLVKGLVAQLSGTIKLQKQPSPVFTIRFPCSPPAGLSPPCQA